MCLPSAILIIITRRRPKRKRRPYQGPPFQAFDLIRGSEFGGHLHADVAAIDNRQDHFAVVVDRRRRRRARRQLLILENIGAIDLDQGALAHVDAGPQVNLLRAADRIEIRVIGVGLSGVDDIASDVPLALADLTLDRRAE